MAKFIMSACQHSVSLRHHKSSTDLKPLPNPFSPDEESRQARQFRTLAAAFEKPGTMGLCERFSILAVLSEQKAKVLQELENSAVSQSKEAQSEGKLLDWPTVKLQTRNRSGEN
jgi:hypothetical protein